jgi:hypothetical protein
MLITALTGSQNEAKCAKLSSFDGVLIDIL